MIVHPEQYIKQTAKLGAMMMNVHVEACTHLHRTVQEIHNAGMKAGVTLNPASPVSLLEDIIDDVDMVLLMSVNPGFGGQKFIENTIQKVKRLRRVQISTDYVFNGTKYTPYVETDTPCPDSVYGSTKLAGELGVSKFCKRSMIIRTAWLYSTFGNNFVKTMIRLGKEKPELGVIFDQIGTPTYARDLARVIMTAIEKGIRPGVYHFSNEGVISWYDFTKAIHRLAGITTCHVRPLHTSEYPTPAHRPHYSVLDKTKLKQTYGIEVPYWEESLAECIAKL